MEPIGIGDHVRIVRTPATIDAGYADREGMCLGFTTPSMNDVVIIGDQTTTTALNIEFAHGDQAWFDPSLVAFLDHAPDTIAIVGEAQLVRHEDGEWTVMPKPRRRSFWRRRRG